MIPVKVALFAFGFFSKGVLCEFEHHDVDLDDTSLLQTSVSVFAAERPERVELPAVSTVVPQIHHRTDDSQLPILDVRRPTALFLHPDPETEVGGSAGDGWCIEDPFTSPALAGVSALAAMAAVAVLTWWLAQPSAVALAAAPESSGKRVRIDAVDGARTLLVTYVIISHSENNMPSFLRPVLGVQHWSMQFFFVLSGFVMTHVSVGKVDVFDGLSASHLLSRRLARLAPVYMLALGSMFIESTIGPNTARPLLSWPLQALFLQSLVPFPVCVVPDQELWWWGENYTHMSGNGAGWFTSAVVFLSFVFPLLYNCRPRAQWGLAFCSAVLIAIVGLRSLPTLLHEHFPPTGGGGLDVYGFAPLRLLEFTAGILAACVCEAMSADTAQRWRGWGWVFDLSLLLALAMALLLPLPLQGLGETSEGGRSPPHGDFFLTGVFSLACIAARCAAEEAAGTGSDSVRGVLGPVLASPTLVAMAEYSFSAYILQAPLGNLIYPEWRVYLWPLKPVLCWGVGYAAMLHVERPIRATVERRIRGPLADQKLPSSAQEPHGTFK